MSEPNAEQDPSNLWPLPDPTHADSDTANATLFVSPSPSDDVAVDDESLHPAIWPSAPNITLRDGGDSASYPDPPPPDLESGLYFCGIPTHRSFYSGPTGKPARADVEDLETVFCSLPAYMDSQ